MPEDSTFYSPSAGQMSFAEVVEQIVALMAEEPQNQYEIVVGTDCHDTPIGEEFSRQREGSKAPPMEFVSAVIVHRLGKGGRYFWRRVQEGDIYTLRQKIYKEASLSFELARRLMRELAARTMLEYNLEIHIDVGEHGRTRELIDEVVGYIRGSGFAVKTKPDAYA
ncbi:MAG: ribonuclease H-like YkuK family protein, partial [Candidatus Bipolaricaulia bacterium]